MQKKLTTVLVAILSTACVIGGASWAMDHGDNFGYIVGMAVLVFWGGYLYLVVRNLFLGRG